MGPACGGGGQLHAGAAPVLNCTDLGRVGGGGLKWNGNAPSCVGVVSRVGHRASGYIEVNFLSAILRYALHDVVYIKSKTPSVLGTWIRGLVVVPWRLGVSSLLFALSRACTFMGGHFRLGAARGRLVLLEESEREEQACAQRWQLALTVPPRR